MQLYNASKNTFTAFNKDRSILDIAPKSFFEVDEVQGKKLMAMYEGQIIAPPATIEGQQEIVSELKAEIVELKKANAALAKKVGDLEASAKSQPRK